MREVGEWWHLGRLDVSHEHLATNATQARLATLRPMGPVRPESPIILSCGPLDHHTLGLEAIGALLRSANGTVAYWVHVHRLSPWLAPPKPGARSRSGLPRRGWASGGHRALNSPQLRGRHVFYAGGAFNSRRARLGVPGQYLGTNLGQAAGLITATLTSTSSP